MDFPHNTSITLLIKTICGVINFIEDRAGISLRELDRSIDERSSKAINSRGYEELYEVLVELENLTDELLYNEGELT